MNSVTDIVEVYDLLYRLGFSATGTPFFHLSYPEVAYQYNSNLLQVVRSIDGFACASWRENAGLLCSLTCRPLTAAPTSAQFLRILTHCIRSGMV